MIASARRPAFSRALAIRRRRTALAFSATPLRTLHPLQTTSVTHLARRAESLAEQNSPDGARTHFETALWLDPRNAEARERLSRLAQAGSH